MSCSLESRLGILVFGALVAAEFRTVGPPHAPHFRPCSRGDSPPSTHLSWPANAGHPAEAARSPNPNKEKEICFDRALLTDKAHQLGGPRSRAMTRGELDEPRAITAAAGSNHQD